MYRSYMSVEEFMWARWISSQHLADDFEPRAILEAVLAVELARGFVAAAELQRYVRAAFDAELRLRRRQHLRAQPETTMLRHDEELIDLGGLSLELEAEHVDREQIARRLAVHARDPRAAEARILEHSREQRAHAQRVVALDVLEAPV